MAPTKAACRSALEGGLAVWRSAGVLGMVELRVDLWRTDALRRNESAELFPGSTAGVRSPPPGADAGVVAEALGCGPELVRIAQRGERGLGAQARFLKRQLRCRSR